MTIRTSVVFDPATVSRWERLAKRWRVSKSEALRRALEAVETQFPTFDKPEFDSMSPEEILDWLRNHPQPPVPGGWGEDPHADPRALREADAAMEEEKQCHRATPTTSVP